MYEGKNYLGHDKADVMLLKPFERADKYYHDLYLLLH